MKPTLYSFSPVMFASNSIRVGIGPIIRPAPHRPSRWPNSNPVALKQRGIYSIAKPSSVRNRTFENPAPHYLIRIIDAVIICVEPFAVSFERKVDSRISVTIMVTDDR